MESSGQHYAVSSLLLWMDVVAVFLSHVRHIFRGFGNPLQLVGHLDIKYSPHAAVSNTQPLVQVRMNTPRSSFSLIVH